MLIALILLYMANVIMAVKCFAQCPVHNDSKLSISISHTMKIIIRRKRKRRRKKDLSPINFYIISTKFSS